MGSRRATKARVITLSVDERAYLDRLVRRRKVGRGDAQRAEIVLLAADGLNNCAIAAKIGVTRQTVRTWRERFAKHRLDGLCDEPRCGAPRKIGDDQVEAIVVKTLEEKPTGATHWSTRDMAKASGVSASSVQRIWRAFSLQPHRTETVKLSTDPQFVEKVRDIVGLYLDPPDKALVICVDEKSHVWMAPGSQAKVDGCRRRACCHVSGLFARRTRPLATMDVRGLGPHQILGFKALLFSRLTRPVGATDTSITFSFLQASCGRSHGLVRPPRPPDSSLLSSSPPRRFAPSCWRAPQQPSIVHSVRAVPGATGWL